MKRLHSGRWHYCGNSSVLRRVKAVNHDPAVLSITFELPTVHPSACWTKNTIRVPVSQTTPLVHLWSWKALRCKSEIFVCLSIHKKCLPAMKMRMKYSVTVLIACTATYYRTHQRTHVLVCYTSFRTDRVAESFFNRSSVVWTVQIYRPAWSHLCSDAG